MSAAASAAVAVCAEAPPRVSVCIPTYRGAATLGAAIESVLAQTLADFDLVVVDDGSPDNTAAVVARYSDRRLRYLRNPVNLGPEGNWNRCLTEARGVYFKLLPHDDLLHPRCLERQAAVLDDDVDQRVALVFSARDVLAPDGRRLRTRGYPGAAEGIVPAHQVVRSCVRRGTNLLGEPGAILLRRSAAEQVGSFDATNPYVIDLDYWFRLLSLGDAYYCNEALAAFRVSSQSWSYRIGRSQHQEFVDFVKRAARTPTREVTPLDFAAARVSARLNMWMRHLFYRLYLR